MDIQSYLVALKTLYGLLTKDGDGTSNTHSDLLDERARLVLKNLLDAATKRVLKVIEGQVEASGTFSPTQLQQSDESFEERLAPQSRLFFTAEGSQNCEQEIDTVRDLNMDGLDVTLLKEKTFSPRGSRGGAVEQSIQSMPASKPQHRQKRCRVCQRNTVKQLESRGEKHFNDAVRNSNRYADHQEKNECDRYLWNSKQEIGSLLNNKSNESKSEKGRQRGPFVSDLDGIEGTDISSNRMVTDIAKMCNSDIEATSESEEVDCFSKEASEAIKQIELCISALHIGADHLHLFEKNCAHPQNCEAKTKLAGPSLPTLYGEVPNGGMSLDEGKSMSRSNFLYELSSEMVVDPVGHPMHQLPSVMAEQRNQKYLPLSQTSKLFQPTKAMFRQSTNNFIRRGQALQSDVSGESGESIDECKSPTKKVNKIYGQNVKAIIDKIESGKWIMSRNEVVPSWTNNAKKFGVALDPNETSYRTSSRPATFSFASKIESSYPSRMAMEDEGRRCRLCQTYKPSGSFMNPNNNENIHSVGSSLNGISTSGARGRNHPPKIMRETLLNKKPSRLLVRSGFHENQLDGIDKNRHYSTAARISLEHQESQGTATDSYSNWTSDQTSSRDSDSEEHSLTDESREELQYATSSRSSVSWGSPLSQGTGSQYSSYTSNSEDDVYSSSGGEEAREVTSSSSSRRGGYSSYEHPIRSYARPTYMSKQSTPEKSGPRRIRKVYGMNHDEQSGTWKRLKDRLAIIFHHHHHHDHHNHNGRTNDQTKMSRNTSLEKRKGRVINSKQQHEAYGEKAVEKTRKSLVREKRQHSHFHGLMEGLLRHVRHSKQSKPVKRNIGQFTEGRKKTLKKSHWWQLLQHHREAELPNKTHMKLKALPNIK